MKRLINQPELAHVRISKDMNEILCSLKTYINGRHETHTQIQVLEMKTTSNKVKSIIRWLVIKANMTFQRKI